MTEEEYKKIIEEKDKQIMHYKKLFKILKKRLLFYKKEAYTDSLTKLNNRRSLENQKDFDVVIIGDIDFFKKINDNYGYLFGDEILVEIGNILKKNTRSSDFVCRWGGEEFIILLKNCDENSAYEKVIKLKKDIYKLGKEKKISLTMSFGISVLHNKTLQLAIEEADKAMFKSKQNGRNTVTIFK